jgi:hypothetical protein
MAIPVNEELTGFDYGFFDGIENIPPLFDVQEEFDFLQNPESYTPYPMSRAKHWCFTVNNYTPESVERILALESEVDYLIFGREIGESGTPHLQGFVSFRTRVRRNTAIERVGQGHFTVARNIDQSIEYCKKEGDFVEFGNRPKSPGSRSDLDEFKKAVKEGELNMKVLRESFSEVVARYPKFCNDFIMDHLPRKTVESFPLRPWQQTLYHDLLLEASDRKVIFIVDGLGNQGKSWFCHYFCGLHENAQVILPGKKADMAYILNPLIRVLFVDAPRSKQGDFLQYDFLEDVKNGYVFAPKYESSIKHLGKIHVVVMMNERPDESKLSMDRYDIRVV